MKIGKITRSGRITYILAGEPDTEGLIKLDEDIHNLQHIHSVSFDISSIRHMPLTLMRIMLICKKKFADTRIAGADKESIKRLKAIGFTDADMNAGEKETEKEAELSLIYVSVDNEYGNEDDAFDPIITFPDFLARKTFTAPDKIIIDQHGEDYTWLDIDRISDIIASDLAAAGVQKGSHVGLCGLNSANWVCAFYALQKLGAMAVFVNYHWRPSEIVRAMISCDVTHFIYGDIPYDISGDEYVSRIMSEAGCSIENFYDIASAVDFKKLYSGTFLVPKVKIMPDDPSVVIFTSGSTSVPNAALVSAQYLFTAAKRYARLNEQTSEDVSCQVLPMFHLFGFLQFLQVSIDDIRTCFPKSVHSGDVLETISTEGCTIMHSVPNQFVAIASHKSLRKYDVSRLRVCMISGAGILPAHMQLLFDTFPHTHFIRFYGLSEMGMAAHTEYHESREHLLHATGHAAKDVDIRIWDPRTGRTVETIGEEGEILLKCFYYQSSSYYGKESGSQPVDDEGYFHTGDMGYISSDGYLHISGRRKEIIIRSGENISPVEVAAAILEHPEVANVEVVGVPDEFYGEEVTACIVPCKQGSLSENELKEFLRDRLASFKVPSYYLFMDELPLLGNGKTDKVSLKKRAANYFKK